MDGRIVLNRAEQRRIVVINHLASGALVNAEAAELLGISKRQLQRLHKAYSEKGVAGLVHGNRGRAAHNTIDAATAARVVELAKDKYRGFNHQHLTEMLAENEGIELSRPTVRRILLQAGISSPRRRRAPQHLRRHARDGVSVRHPDGRLCRPPLGLLPRQGGPLAQALTRRAAGGPTRTNSIRPPSQ